MCGFEQSEKGMEFFMTKNRNILIFFFLMFFILSLAIVVQIRSLTNGNTPFVKIETSNELRDEVLKIKEKYDNNLKQIEKAENKLEKIREESTSNDEDSKKKQEEIKLYNQILRTYRCERTRNCN